MGDVVKPATQSRTWAPSIAVLLGAIVVASSPGTLRAAPPNAAPTTKPTTPAAATSVGAGVVRSAMAEVTIRLATDLAAHAKQAVISVAPLRADEAAPRGPELTDKISALLAGQLSGATAAAEPMSLGKALHYARRSAWLVYVQTEIVRGQLRVTADVYRGTRNVWERARTAVPAPVLHAVASARVDGEVRAYLQAAPLVGARIDRVTTEDRDVIALACGDTDDDGDVEIVTLGRRKLAVGRARGGRFVPLRSAELRDWSGIANAPLREPIGGVAILRTPQGRVLLDVGITDRARGARLDGDLRRVAAITGVPVSTPSGDTCLRFQSSTLSTTFAKCADDDSASFAEDGESSVDAAAFASFVTSDGKVRIVDGRRDSRTGDLTLRNAERTAALPHAGAQIALGDLDQDGSPEVISTLDVLAKEDDAPDALVVTTWDPDGSLRERLRTPVATGVRAVAVCPPQTGGASAIVLATVGELWIIR